jgi:hypothetical protein
MTTGWPQNQQDLRWPYADNDDTGPAGSVRGRLATETDPGTTDVPMFGSDHPSAPLPIGPMRDRLASESEQRGDRRQRGRLGRKSRGGRDEFGPEDGAAGDADYDWIKYLGEAGPAQESAKRPADSHGSRNPAPAVSEPRGPASGSDEPGGGRGAARRLPRRHAASSGPASPGLGSAGLGSAGPAASGPTATPSPGAWAADSQATRFFDAADTDQIGRASCRERVLSCV